MASQRFRPPRLAFPAEVRWMLLRAFGPPAAPFSGAVEPAAVLAVARRFEVSERIASRQGRDGLAAELEPAAAAGFARDRTSAAAVAMRLMALARRVADAAASLGIPIAFLKFVALEGAGLLSPGSRGACDVDALAPGERAGDLWRQLRAAGWQSSGLADSEHQLPALVEPESGGLVEIHRLLLGVRLERGASANFAALERYRLLAPLADFPGRCWVPVPEVQAAHSLVHGLGQHGFWPSSYSLLKMVADLTDLGALTDRALGWVAKDIPATEGEAARRLCARLSRGEDPAGWTGPEEVLLRHMVAGRLDADYERALRLGLFRSQPSDRRGVVRLAHAVKNAVFLADSQVEALYGRPRSWLGYLGWRMVRPFDLLLRLGRYGWARVRK